jgi:penicillin-binding protein 2
MSGRSWRHPLGGARRFAHTVRSPVPQPRRPRRRIKRRPRRSVNVGALVANPQELPSRPNVRLAVIGVIFLALFAGMVLRLWSLQVIGQKTANAAVKSNAVRVVSVPAPRGEILDRTDRVLVGNQVEEQIVLSRYEAIIDPQIISKVAALVGETPRQIQSALNASQYSVYQPVPVLTGAPLATIQYLQEHQTEFPGVSVQETTVRNYPVGNGCGCVAPQVLGYVGSISAQELKANPNAGYQPTSQVGQSGLEREYEQNLRGVNGSDELVVNATNQVVGTLHKTAPKQGDILVTNIDANLQEAAQGYLQQVITADRNTVDPTTGVYPAALDGAAIVEDVQTGQILAMASYPPYSLNAWSGGISNAAYNSLTQGCQSGLGGCPLDNYAIDGLYTPGSTFKLATATAALNTGLVSPASSFDDTGLFKVPGCNTSAANAGCQFHDAEAAGAGEVNVTKSLAISDDYYFYELGYLFYADAKQYGVTPIQKMADQYGLDQITGIDLPGEVQGRVDSQAERQLLHKEAPGAFPNTTWYVGDNLEMAFGQGATVVTPIELANAYATFANGGTRYQPQVAAALVDPTTDKVLKRFAPRVTGHVSIPAADYSALLQGFEGAVEYGTAAGTFRTYAGFSLSRFQIAGKTGTADTSPSSITNGTKEPNAWFVAFGPEPNPKYVVAVVVSQGGYGASAAAPAVMNIFNYLVTNPISPVQLPTAANPPTTTPLPYNAPAGATTTTTTTTSPPHG